MGYQQNQGGQVVSGDSDISMSGDDFKGLNPDLWIDIAVKMCIKAGGENPTAYYLAVDNLEALLCNQIDDDYESKLKEKMDILKEEYGATLDALTAARAKFKALMTLIKRKTPEEAFLRL